MSDISQQMSLDASQVLSTIEKLNTGYASLASTMQGMAGSFGSFNRSSAAVEKTLSNMGRSASQAVSAMSKLSGVNVGSSAASAAQQVQQLGAAAQANMGAAARSTNSFTVSWATMSRVVTTQAIVRAMSAIRGSIEDSFEGFTQFNKAAAEVQTILDAPLEDIRDKLRQLSDEFNTPILQVANAQYTALSNGFTTAAESTRVLEAGLRFAKIGISSATQGVDLLTSSLNAYGQTSEQVDELNGKMFKTVDLGRLIGSDLASGFGRVAPAMRAVGVSMDEILAGMSSITIAGSKPSEATTQLRAVASALLKPSEAAKEAFHKLGVESGQELVEAKGLQGALQAMIGTTDGTAASVAKLFQNVRALNGVLRLTSDDGAATYQRHLKEIDATGADFAKKKYELRVESNAEQVSKQLNQLGNSIKVDIGEQLVNAAGLALRFSGGVDGIKVGAAALLPILAAGGAALAVYGAALAAAAAKQQLLQAANQKTATSLSNLSGALRGALYAFAAWEVGRTIGRNLTEQLELPNKAAAEAGKQWEETQRKAAADVAKAANDAEVQRYRDSANAAAKIRALFFEQVDAAKSANESLLEQDKSAMDSIVEQHEAAARKSAQAFEKANDDIADSRKRVGDLKSTLADQQFSFAGRNLAPVQQSSRDAQRALELAKTASGFLSKGDKESADAAYRRAESYAEAAASAARASKNVVAEGNAEKTVESILQQHIKAEAAFQKQRAGQAASQKKNSEDETARAKQLAKLRDDFLKHSNAFDEQGKPLSGKQLAENMGKARSELKEFVEKGGVSVPELVATPAALDKIWEQVNGTFKQRQIAVRLAVDPSKLTKDMNLQELLHEGATQRSQEHKENQREIGANQKIKEANAAITSAKAQAGVLLTEKPGFFERFANLAHGPMNPKEVAAEASFRRQILELTKPGRPLVQSQVQSLAARGQELSQNGSQAFQMALKRDADALNALNAGIYSAANSLKAAAAQIEQGSQAPKLPESEDVEGHATGGLIYRAKGGAVDLVTRMAKPHYLASGGWAPKGTDTVRAMLSPGEFVVNAHSASKFYSQLQSINAGREPEYKAGGTVNHNWGGVNVNVNGAEAPTQTARAVANEMKRMARLQ